VFERAGLVGIVVLRPVDVHLRGPPTTHAWPCREQSPRKVARSGPRLDKTPGNSGFPEADDEARTRDLRLGKPTLYQLSYIRVCPPILAIRPIGPT
jgi:hypothetical protein